MKKIVISVVAVLVIVTAMYLVISSSSEKSTTQNKSDEKSSIIEAETKPEATQMLTETKSSLGYVSYSEQNLIDAKESNRIIFFHAPWCSTCNFFEGQIEDEGVPSDITILKVDYDSDTELKKKYGVNVQSTFVLLDSNGDVKESWPFARGLKNIQDLYDQTKI